MADLVEEWKRLARARIGRPPHAAHRAPCIRVQVTFGFMLVCAAIGASHGPGGAVAAVLGLTSVVLAQELPPALLARLLGRQSSVLLSASGVRAEITGPPLRGLAGVAEQTVGSLVNFALAIAASNLSRRGVAGSLTLPLQALSMSHAAWGAAQVLPVLPFRCGRALASRLPLRLRFVHAGASAAAICLCLGALADWPLLEPVILLALFAPATAFAVLATERYDERSGVGPLAERAEALLSSGSAADAADLAERGLAAVCSQRVRERLSITLAWAAIGMRDPLLAHWAIALLPARAIDDSLVAAYLSCCNRDAEAEQLLGEARNGRHRDRETAELLVELRTAREIH